MKRFLLTLTAIFMCYGAYAHTINWHVGNTILETTTCDSGESITPPTAPYKYGYHFVEWKLPYTPIEYLESTGTQYIDTGYIHNTSTRISFSLKTKIPHYNNGIEQEIIGGGTAISGFNVWLDSQGLKCYNAPWRSTAASILATPVTENEIIEVNGWFDTEGFYCDFTNSPKAGYSYNTLTSYSIWLFARPDRSNYYPGKIYYTKLYDNDVLVRDFIPVLDKDGVPCMYDKVEHKFYYNAGTGDFIAGPVIGE